MNRCVVIIFSALLGIGVLALLSAYRMTNNDPGVVEFVLGPWKRNGAPLFPDTSTPLDSSTKSSEKSSLKSHSSSSSPKDTSSLPRLSFSHSFNSSINFKLPPQDRPHSRKKRQVPCQRGEELDEYVDSLFRFASRLIRAMEPFSGNIPNITIELPEFNLIIFAHSGGATHAYTIARKKPAWVMCQNGSISLGLTVGFEELRIMYKFRVIQDWKLLFDGELEAQISHPKVQIQFTQTTPDEDSEEAVQQRVDALRIWSVGHIRVMLKGLGNLTQAVSLFLTGFLNRNIDSFMPQIRDGEKQAVGFINNLLQNLSIPFFSII